MDSTTIEKFIIKNPKWVFYVVFIFTALNLVVAVVLTVLFCMNIIGFFDFVIPISIVAVLLIISVISLFGYYREKFIFENETFTSINMIGKKQTVKIEDLTSVNLYFYGFTKVKEFKYIKLYPKGYVQIEMIVGEDKIALKLSDYYGTVFKNGFFGLVLTQRNIPVKEFFKE